MYKIIKKATMMLFAAVLSIGMAVSAGTVTIINLRFTMRNVGRTWNHPSGKTVYLYQ